jgi:hypothetical protein
MSGAGSTANQWRRKELAGLLVLFFYDSDSSSPEIQFQFQPLNSTEE